MIIGINASFLRKIDSGIGQVTVNFLRQLIKEERSKEKRERNKFIFYLEEDFDQQLIGLRADEEEFFRKEIFLPIYRRDDLIRKIWWEKWLLPRKAKRDGCTVFFSLYQSATVFNKNKNIKHLMLVHDVIWKIFPQYLNNLRKKIYYFLVEKAIIKANKILTVSHSSKQDLKKFLDLEKEKVTVATIDCDKSFKLSTTKKQGTTEILATYKIDKSGYIFYVGGFDVRKNVGLLIEAYGCLWKKYQENDWQKKWTFPDLVLAGKFNADLVPVVENLPQKIDEITKKYALPKEKIKMVGFVKQEDLPIFYYQASLFVFPSLYEGFGLSPLEAFNCGCPALVNNNSSLKEITEKNSLISMVMNDPEKLAEKMQKVLVNDYLQKKMIAIEKKQTVKFSWKNFNSKVAKELNELKTV